MCKFDWCMLELKSYHTPLLCRHSYTISPTLTQRKNYNKCNQCFAFQSLLIAIKNLPSLLGVNENLMGTDMFSKPSWSLVISELCTPTTLQRLIDCASTISDLDKLR